MSALGRLVGMFRRFRSAVLRSPVRRVGRCNLCGRCCCNITLMHDGRWLASDEDYRIMVEDAPEHGRFKPVGRNPAGLMTFNCRCLSDDNSCTSYADRPSLCRNYPSKSIYYQGEEPLKDCGYSFRCVTFTQAVRRLLAGKTDFSQVLDRELRRGAEPKTKETDQ